MDTNHSPYNPYPNQAAGQTASQPVSSANFAPQQMSWADQGAGHPYQPASYPYQGASYPNPVAGIALQPSGYPVQQEGYPIPAQPVKQPKGTARMWAAFALAFATMIIQAFAFMFAMLSGSDDAMLTVGELAGGICALLFIIALGGKSLVVPSLKGMGESWRILRWIFLIDAVVTVVDIGAVIIDGSFVVATLWPLRLLLLFLMCVGIGLFEETVFRGLILGGLLARMGVSCRGLFWAVVISSIIFGLAHIDITSMDFADPSQIAQALLKVAQTGIFGFATAVAVVVTGNIWPCILVHGLNDFMLMCVFNGLSAEPVTTEYVSSGADGLVAIGVYALLIVCYLPSLIAAYRTLKEHPLPDRGPFYRPRTPYPAAYAPLR